MKTRMHAEDFQQKTERIFVYAPTCTPSQFWHHSHQDHLHERCFLKVSMLFISYQNWFGGQKKKKREKVSSSSYIILRIHFFLPYILPCTILYCTVYINWKIFFAENFPCPISQWLKSTNGWRRYSFLVWNFTFKKLRFFVFMYNLWTSKAKFWLCFLTSASLLLRVQGGLWMKKTLRLIYNVCMK